MASARLTFILECFVQLEDPPPGGVRLISQGVRKSLRQGVVRLPFLQIRQLFAAGSAENCVPLRSQATMAPCPPV